MQAARTIERRLRGAKVSVEVRGLESVICTDAGEKLNMRPGT